MEVLDVSKFRYNDHAIKRFMQRTDCDNPKEAVRIIRSTLKLARKAQRKNYINVFFKYKETPADYYITNSWIFVVVDNEVTTCYQKDPKEIKRLYRPVEE